MPLICRLNFILSIVLVCGLAAGHAVTAAEQETNGAVIHPNLQDAPWMDFAMPWDQPLPAPVAMASRVLDAPAGKHGPVQARGERLVFKDGTPVRLWGVGIAFSNGFSQDGLPPPKLAAARLADKIASYGFNHVRLVGFDGNAPEAIMEWRKTGRVESLLLDRLDYFVSELRKRGIYYSLSLNNNSSKLFEDSDILPPNTATMRFAHYRTVRILDTRARAQIAAWTRAFFDHRNPYTGLTYAKDPANVYFNAINEDSAFIASYGRYKNFSDEWVERINRDFAKYLVQRYPKRADLESAWSRLGRIDLLPGENPYKGNIELRPRLPGFFVSDGRKRDTADYLLTLDFDAVRRVRDALTVVGYAGLFTGNNKWYGDGSLYSDYINGNYTEGHAYFGGMSQSKKTKDEIMRLANRSYIDSMSAGPGAMKSLLQDTRFGLSRVLPANLIDRPHIISEWNDLIWGDYAYEGPFLLTGLGLKMGVDGMDLHTLYNHPKPRFADAIPRDNFSLMGNPLLTAILPSLGLAFQRGDIAQAMPRKIICLGRDRNEVLSRALERPHTRTELVDAVLEYGLTHVRTALGEGCNAPDDTATQRQSTDQNDHQVSWRATTSGKGLLNIATERFEAIVGELHQAAAGSRVLSADLDYPGSISAISLDGLLLKDSRCILATVAGPIRNKGARARYEGDAKIIDSLGTGTPQMRGNVGVVKLALAKSAGTLKLWQLLADGRYTALDARTSQEDGQYQVSFEAARLGTPWVVIGDASCLARSTQKR